MKVIPQAVLLIKCPACKTRAIVNVGRKDLKCLGCQATLELENCEKNILEIS
jgi:hypothetical protein